MPAASIGIAKMTALEGFWYLKIVSTDSRDFSETYQVTLGTSMSESMAGMVLYWMGLGLI